MLQSNRIHILFLCGAVVACSGQSDDSEIRVARVGDNMLYLSEIEEFVPEGISYSDSILIAEDFVRKWIERELLIKKAEENLTPEQLDVSEEIADYRNSLIIYKYKNQMVAQKMDTIVRDAEIEEYYSQHAENFHLTHTIVKAAFVKIPEEVADPELLKLYCMNSSDEDFRDLKEYSLQYAKSFDTFNDTWVDFRRVIINLPDLPEDPEKFLTGNKILEIRDSAFYYVVCIRDYKLAGEPAPVEYLKGQIKGLILNRRKMEFLKKIEQDIYTEGLRSHKFNIYDRKKQP
jgi:hypothetical protein